jgi:hypothetical protein
MCLTSSSAELTATKGITYKTYKEDKLFHGFIYSNNVKNKSKGKNSLILPIPSVEFSMIDGTPMIKVLEDLISSVPVAKSFSRGMSLEILKCGQYDYIKVSKGELQQSLNEFSIDSNPKLVQAIENYFGKHDFSYAVLTFDNDKTIDMQPIHIEWQEDDENSLLYFPMMDSHGEFDENTKHGFPAFVDRDHIIFTPGNTDWPVIKAEGLYDFKNYKYFEYKGNLQNGDLFIFNNSQAHIKIFK